MAALSAGTCGRIGETVRVLDFCNNKILYAPQ